MTLLSGERLWATGDRSEHSVEAKQGSGVGLKTKLNAKTPRDATTQTQWEKGKKINTLSAVAIFSKLVKKRQFDFSTLESTR